MTIEQVWNSIFWQVRALFDLAATPFIALAARAGVELNSGQVWMLFFTLTFAIVLAVFLNDEHILARRGMRTTGKVVGIDPGDEAPDTPIIEFRDDRGNPVVFRSLYGCTAETGQLGAKVPIVFDPRKPTRVREIGRGGAKAYHVGFLVLFVILLGFATWAAKDAIY